MQMRNKLDASDVLSTFSLRCISSSMMGFHPLSRRSRLCIGERCSILWPPFPKLERAIPDEDCWPRSSCAFLPDPAAGLEMGTSQGMDLNPMEDERLSPFAYPPRMNCRSWLLLATSG